MASKHQESRLLNGAKDFSFFLVGSLIYAVSVTAFTAPNQIAPGGITGISTMLNYVWGLPIGTLSLVLNLPNFTGNRAVARLYARRYNRWNRYDGASAGETFPSSFHGETDDGD